MATLLLSAVGTLVGGPLGGAIGAIAGRQIDARILGAPSREGPRLKELAVSTSSYGTPIAQVHGTMRMPGSIIWATDLVESRETQGNGKGQPKTTTYAYSTSFAVAVSSRPIESVGRIWADGNLLRGAAGDLKTSGTMRVYKGHGNQPVDPLIAATEGQQSPAFRNLAYVVFEYLDLTDFGNRIPTLSFEVSAAEQQVSLAGMVERSGFEIESEVTLEGMGGFALDGGPLGNAFDTIGRFYPLACDASDHVLRIADREQPASSVVLPESAAAWDPSDFGQSQGRRTNRQTSRSTDPVGLRYYDPARDYQPGIQRTSGQAPIGTQTIYELPAALDASAAKSLTEKVKQRSTWKKDRLAWRLAELDPVLRPGASVTVPGHPGVWSIESWEWRERGIELELVRLQPGPAREGGAATAAGIVADDLMPGHLSLDFFELPLESHNQAGGPRYFISASVPGRQTGAAFFYVADTALEPLSVTSRADAVQGTLAQPLESSPALRFENFATMRVELADDKQELMPATPEALARGANRLLVGEEIIQFADPVPLGDNLWDLRGLLRGRAATESAAMAGHEPGVPIVLLDDRILDVSAALGGFTEGDQVAAIGGLSSEPTYAQLRNAGASGKPPTPVHPRGGHQPGIGYNLCWTRRARGAWIWPGDVDVPLVEEAEQYRVGIGAVSAPVATWTVSAPAITLSDTEIAALQPAASGADVWVQQIGTIGVSHALLLTRLP